MKRLFCCGIHLLTTTWLLVLLLTASANASPYGRYYTVQDLGTLGGLGSVANGINDDLQVVGAADLPDGSPHAFLWSSGQMRDLGGLGGNRSEALRINAEGVAVGSATDATNVRKPVRWTNGMIEDLSPTRGAGIAYDITDSGQIATGIAGSPMAISKPES